MTFIVSNLIKDVLKAHQIERYQAFVLSWRFQGVFIVINIERDLIRNSCSEAMHFST